MSGTVPDLDGCEQSERADRYRQKAAHFKDMASTETHPRVRAQLLGLAKEYDELADHWSAKTEHQRARSASRERRTGDR